MLVICVSICLSVMSLFVYMCICLSLCLHIAGYICTHVCCMHNNWLMKVFYSVCIYGGGDRGGQIRTVKKGVDIVIGEIALVLKSSIVISVHIQPLPGDSMIFS